MSLSVSPHLLAAPPHLAAPPANHAAPPCRAALPAHCAHCGRDLGRPGCSPCRARGSSSCSPRWGYSLPARLAGAAPAAHRTKSGWGHPSCLSLLGATPGACHAGGRPSCLSLVVGLRMPSIFLHRFRRVVRPPAATTLISSAVDNHCLDRSPPPQNVVSPPPPSPCFVAF
jgi:hypothetical protein